MTSLAIAAAATAAALASAAPAATIAARAIFTCAAFRTLFTSIAFRAINASGALCALLTFWTILAALRAVTTRIASRLSRLRRSGNRSIRSSRLNAHRLLFDFRHAFSLFIFTVGALFAATLLRLGGATTATASATGREFAACASR
jgi:hypothetical protein